jgi:hypothetical protein
MHTNAIHRRSLRQRKSIVGVVTGVLAGKSKSGDPLVLFPESPTNDMLTARSVPRWTKQDIGREIVLMFENGHPEKPVIVGFLQPLAVDSANLITEVAGERLEISAEREIVFRCGKASITLTRSGRIILRGVDLLSRSSGSNRIKGASVQIN